MHGLHVTDCVSIFPNGSGTCDFQAILHISVLYHDVIPRAEAKAVKRSDVYNFVGIRIARDSH